MSGSSQSVHSARDLAFDDQSSQASLESAQRRVPSMRSDGRPSGAGRGSALGSHASPRRQKLQDLEQKLSLLQFTANSISPDSSLSSWRSPSRLSRASRSSMGLAHSSPQLSSQTAAERHLVQTIDETRRALDSDVMVALMERVVANTVAVYTLAGDDLALQRALDRVSSSLADVIQRYERNERYARH